MNYEVMVGIVVVGALGWKLLDKLPPNFMKSIDAGANGLGGREAIHNSSFRTVDM